MPPYRPHFSHNSPVPRAATGPVHHACCMHSVTSATVTATVASPGHGEARSGWLGVSHAPATSYAAKERRRKRTCSVRRIAQKGASQYPISAVCRAR